jgi:hypothetical protein
LLIQRIEDLHWPVSQVAASAGVSRQAAYKWLHRWQKEGLDGLRDRSSRPHTSPRLVPEDVARELRLDSIEAGRDPPKALPHLFVENLKAVDYHGGKLDSYPFSRHGTHHPISDLRSVNCC